jgi:hypothetical protein
LPLLYGNNRQEEKATMGNPISSEKTIVKKTDGILSMGIIFPGIGTSAYTRKWRNTTLLLSALFAAAVAYFGSSFIPFGLFPGLALCFTVQSFVIQKKQKALSQA